MPLELEAVFYLLILVKDYVFDNYLVEVGAFLLIVGFTHLIAYRARKS